MRTPGKLPLDEPADFDEGAAIRAVSTGRLPSEERVAELVAAAHKRFATLDQGKVADYIPALASAPRDCFAICVAGINGEVHAAGDADWPFTLQSLSKPFVFALICQEIGPMAARRKLGVNATGMPFNSVMAIELDADRITNPMVNSGAIATSSLAPGATVAEKFAFIADGLSRFAGRPLELDEEVYESEAATNQRNRGIAKLLEGYERMYCDALDATDVYTRQCALRVTARDLAVMAATLADGGVNPVTRERVIDAVLCKRVLAVLATAGLYEHSGEWLYEIGLPCKSGVSGGILAVAPGKGGLGVFSPPLDAAGNSVRGRRVVRFLSEEMGLNLFTSRPVD